MQRINIGTKGYNFITENVPQDLPLYQQLHAWGNMNPISPVTWDTGVSGIGLCYATPKSTFYFRDLVTHRINYSTSIKLVNDVRHDYYMKNGRSIDDARSYSSLVMIQDIIANGVRPAILFSSHLSTGII